MAASKGGALRVKISVADGGAGTYYTVAGIKSASMKREGQTVDVTTLTDADVVRLGTLRDASYELSGNYESGDTNGQNAMLASLGGATPLWVQFLPNGTAGWKQEVLLTNHELGGDPTTQMTVSMSLQASGAAATV